MSSLRLRRAILSLASIALFAAPAVVAVSFTSDAKAAPAKKDPLADALGGQIFFLSSAPPDPVSGPGWFTSNRITKKDENSDKKWSLHTMIFLKKPLDVNKLDLMVYKIDKTGTVSLAQDLEQFPSGDGRSFYFLITLRDQSPYEPNLKYQVKVVASTGPVAETTIELDGKEEKISGGPIDFTGGADYSKKTEVEKPSAPFDADAAKEALKKVIYEDCKTAASKGGTVKIWITFSAKDGKVLKAEFPPDPPVPYSDGTQKCIVGRFEKAKTKPFTSADSKTVAYNVSL